MSEYINYDDLPDEPVPFDWSSAVQFGEDQTINIPDGRVMIRKIFKDKNGQFMGEDSYQLQLFTKPINKNDT